MTPAERARILFTEEHGVCCSCCAGYCPRDDASSDAWLWPLCRLTVAGVTYVSDRLIMIREDLLEFVDATIVDTTTQELSWATIPAQQPAAAGRDRMPAAQVLDRLDRAGFGLHIAEGDDRMSHLYLDGQHVGWTIRAKDGWQCDLADLQLIRSVAIAATITLSNAATAVWVAQAREGAQ